jgi:hypothetical protein
VANAEHEAGQQAQRQSLEHYRKAGEALIRAKTAAGHGNWLKTLKEQAQFSQQRASEYMRLAAGWGNLPHGGSLTLKAALGLIGVDPTTAWRYLNALCVDGILLPVEKGSKASGKASRFHYLLSEGGAA